MNFFTEQLIEFVKENECIYNSKSTAYKNTQFKDLIWQKIAVELNASGNLLVVSLNISIIRLPMYVQHI